SRLLGEPRGLALWGDDDAGHELQLGDRCQKAVEDEGLVERRVDVIRLLPAGVHRRVGAENVVVDLDMPVAERLDLADIRPDGVGVGRDLRLRIDDADLHGHARSSRTRGTTWVP